MAEKETASAQPRSVVIISANADWKVIRSLYPDHEPQTSPYGEWFIVSLAIRSTDAPVIYLHGGWGKIAAAASAQYVIDRWSPSLLINLGTCGGFAGQIEKGTIILVERTLVYDIIEQMSDGEAAIAHYATDIDLTWLGESYPHAVQRALLVSADRDLVVDEIAHLQSRYNAVAGDWESGALAWVAARNQTHCLILRGVSDLVGSDHGEAYGNYDLFVEGTTIVMRRLVDALPQWIMLSSHAI
ncbi:MAG TPA: hypothetical protein VNE61_05765 [Ktedonobacteraceae bacterium]|nr:hypothetical protein [Ktedonobacteraceae bacterium]